MGVQAVFGFLEAHVHVEVVHDGVGDFLAAVGGEAVGDLAMCRCELQELVVNLERQEVALLGCLFAFLAHGNPHVAVKNVGVLDGILRVVEHAVLATVLLETFFGFFHDLGRLFVALRAGEREVHADLACEGEEGVRHVVAVTDEGDCLSLHAAEILFDHLGEGDCLAGVVVVGQGIHDRDAAVFGKLFHEILLEAADDDGVHPAAEATGDILDAFAFAKSDGIRGEEYGVTAELVHAHLEGRDGSQRRFFEEHADVLAMESVRNFACMDFLFKLRGNFDGFENAFFAPVVQTEEVLAAIDHFLSFGQSAQSKKRKKAIRITRGANGRISS